ncbi:putative phage abortive infection protein [Scandinavium manionii]|uniref:putative phage abortive infection protein n=1 Tax=Scandinavium manionii TaxID=2926520 RepID=UPI0021664CBA|nr:putative phage abortive infection protein [Scandinavium manionii]MCS2168044.1 putative phage abortive infection protein [Scandinavium manionii]
MSVSHVINAVIAFGTILAAFTAIYSTANSSFKSTFSLLLSQHNEALEKLKNSTRYNDILLKVIKKNSELSVSNKEMHDHDDIFGSYFRVLYHLLKFIDNKAGSYPFDIEVKKEYTSLVRSFLDNETLLFLAINCSHANNDNQYHLYKTLIERYAMLEHLILDEKYMEKYLSKDENQHIIKYNAMDHSRSEKESELANEKYFSAINDTLLKDIAIAYHSSAFGTNPSLAKYTQNKNTHYPL